MGVSVAGSSGQKGNGGRVQPVESYNPSKLPHGNNVLKMSTEGAYAADAAQQQARDRQEYHQFTLGSANKKDFVQTPTRISGRNADGITNETAFLWPDKKGGLHSMATAGEYNQMRGVGMNHARFRADQINGDLATFKANGVTGVIMTPSPSRGNPPPYYYDAEHNSTYGP